MLTRREVTTTPTAVSNTQIVDPENESSRLAGNTTFDISVNGETTSPVNQSSKYAFGFLGNSENLLDWPDLFSMDYSFLDCFSPRFDRASINGQETHNISSSITSPSMTHDSNDACPLWIAQERNAQDVSCEGLTFSETQKAMTLELGQIDTHMLFKHIKDHCFPQLWSSSIGRKSPLETHLTAAVLTFANITYLAPRQTSHASLMNLLALLAISSKHLATQLSQTEPEKSNHWNQYAESTFKKAKHHLVHSLNNEICPKVAKYKDIVMAVSSMICFSILYDRQYDARRYLVDAERLLLEQGLHKSYISGKTKLLHHTYTWNRIVSERSYTEPSFDRSDGSHMTGHTMIPNVNLDDFLHFEPHQQEKDSSSRETGRESLHDIHLKQDQGISDSTFIMLYGVSETWLSLVSQTTRLANLMQAVKHGSKEDKPSLYEHIERHKWVLEHRICSFSMTGATTSTSIDSNHLVDIYSQESQPTTRSHLVRALNFALIIFFYRRIYNVHPHILQQYVNVVAKSLQEFELYCEKEGQSGPGSPWPAFMAGCEAMTKKYRDYFEDWFDRAFARTGFTRLLTAKKCMQKVWEWLDCSQVNDGELMQRYWTWMQISEEQDLYILLS
ncbi:hypothetical protein FSST1_006926 [Fusarium sambucinum]